MVLVGCKFEPAKSFVEISRYPLTQQISTPKSEFPVGEPLHCSGRIPSHGLFVVNLHESPAREDFAQCGLCGGFTQFRCSHISLDSLGAISGRSVSRDGPMNRRGR